MANITIRRPELAAASPRQAENRETLNRANPGAATQSMDPLSLSYDAPHDDPQEDLDHLSLTSDEPRADSDDDRWM